MHLHLDPIGGIAGDMFAAAMLDLHPEWEAELVDALESAGLLRFVQVGSYHHKDHALTGRRFRAERGPEAPPHDYRAIRELLEASPLDGAVRERALALFAILAKAESGVHDVPLDEVHFHEIGDWDSIADLVCAAWLIERTGGATWSASALPMGAGRVKTAHGMLSVPAPATASILEGFPLFHDGHDGERITPTGAAIVKSLNPSFAPMHQIRRLLGTGTGFGTRTFEGMSNVLRVLAFEDPLEVGVEQVAACHFEVDDQTPEDLALALDRVRAREGVLDVLQMPAFGKKGRMAVQVQVLLEPEHLDPVVECCFTETSTLGIRWQIVSRAVLARESDTTRVEGRTYRLKSASRPGSVVSRKVEADDLAGAPGGFVARQRVKSLVEHTAPRGDDESEES